MIPTFEVDRRSVALVAKRMHKMQGMARAIEGRLTEHMHYALSQEMGGPNFHARAHMRPAYLSMFVTAIPKMMKVLRRGLEDIARGILVNIDSVGVRAIAAALYEMEADRVRHLRRQIYDIDRTNIAYELTGNLLNNRTIKVWAKGTGIKVEPSMPKLGYPGG